MQYKIDDCDCKLRTEDNQNRHTRSKVLWSIVTDTPRECELDLENPATHKVRLELNTRTSLSGTIEVNCEDNCVKYCSDFEEFNDVKVNEDQTKIEKEFIIDPPNPTYSIEFEICFHCRNGRDTEKLYTAIKSEDNQTNDTIVRDGGANENEILLELKPEVTLPKGND